MGAEGGMTGGRGQQAAPGCGVSVGAAAEGRVQALGPDAGREGPPWGAAFLPAEFRRGRGGAGQVGGNGAGGSGRSQAQEVGKHQVFFAQESSLVVGPGALSPTQQLKEF